VKAHIRQGFALVGEQREMPAAAIAAAAWVLVEKNVAGGPAHLGAQGCERFESERPSENRHVEAAGDSGLPSALFGAVLPAAGPLAPASRFRRWPVLFVPQVGRPRSAIT